VAVELHRVQGLAVLGVGGGHVSGVEGAADDAAAPLRLRSEALQDQREVIGLCGGTSGVGLVGLVTGTGGDLAPVLGGHQVLQGQLGEVGRHGHVPAGRAPLHRVDRLVDLQGEVLDGDVEGDAVVGGAHALPLGGDRGLVKFEVDLLVVRFGGSNPAAVQLPGAGGEVAGVDDDSHRYSFVFLVRGAGLAGSADCWGVAAAVACPVEGCGCSGVRSSRT